ncbi:SPOR domain-containing protein [Butyricimonas paravirosa]|uniref:SPOR domain-containing protein n=1 Tax=Butyricimonas paravirosa TaxID=1472417 RepID=UPI00210CF85D|nr:SPOR domain-containing protein [Butyricimonas paravirosa]MCQ4873558.1 SPOR domain-containing protein [Butyricimonas paravirosa]
MKLTLVILSFFVTTLVYAQTDTIPSDSIVPVKKEIDFLKQLSETDSITGGKVVVHGDQKIEQLLKLNISVNRKEHAFQGYRIQILSASSYNTNIDTLKNYTKRFEEEFPEIPAYLQYTDPDFKIRVGNFRTRIEAIPTLKRIRKKYAGAYPVKTIIYLNELNPVQEQDTITSPANTGNFNF